MFTLLVLGNAVGIQDMGEVLWVQYDVGPFWWIIVFVANCVVEHVLDARHTYVVIVNDDSGVIHIAVAANATFPLWRCGWLHG